MRQLSDSDGEDCKPTRISHLPIEESSRHNILTRRKTLAMESSLTLFNLKALSNVSDLLQTVDAARKDRNLRLPADTLHVQTSSPENDGTQRTLLANHDNRQALFPVVKDLLERTIAPKFCERVWSCLLPTGSYPLGEDFARTVDPTSLFQRSIFTPAEDDLLLRGMIMTVNESATSAPNAEGTNWEQVQKRFLPSKDKWLLQYRQIQLISSEENSKFQRSSSFSTCFS